MKNYTDLVVWQKTRELVSFINELATRFPQEESFGLVHQMRRSVVSIPANIAEVRWRNTSKDTVRFLFMAGASLYELETRAFVSFDRRYIAPTNWKQRRLVSRNARSSCMASLITTGKAEQFPTHH